MKEVRAIIRPNRRERLREALRAIPNFPGVSMFSAQGFTAPASVDKRSVRDELTDFTEKYMVCVLCPDDMVETIRNVIIKSCTTGQIGDGLVWVLDVASVHRVRNGEPMA
ncbi:MAG: P-II family nitrogen regulator [Burkholderiales bacterium]|jgi:nitrogen regulatory protein P-II 1